MPRSPSLRLTFFGLALALCFASQQSSTLAQAAQAVPVPVNPATGFDSASGITVAEVTTPDEKLPSFGVATLSVCNNRVNPANAAEMATQMLLGTPVEILARERSYYQVRTPEGYVSWTEGSGVALMEADAFAKWKLATKIVVINEYTHAYVSPSDKAARVSDLVAGDMLQLLGKSNGFFKVAYPDGRIAYLATRDGQNYEQWAARKNPGAEQILAVAKTMMGVPYLWGGTSVKGVDCSGFTKTSYFLNGVVIPRDASQQAVVGEVVDIMDGNTASLEKCLKNLQPGDLLFFGSNRDAATTPRVSHTAIYMGGGEFIQAAGQVRVNSLVPGAPNYADAGRRRLVGARRFLTAIGTEGITRVDRHPAYAAKN